MNFVSIDGDGFLDSHGLFRLPRAVHHIRENNSPLDLVPHRNHGAGRLPQRAGGQRLAGDLITLLVSTIAQVEHGQLHLEAEGIGTVLVLVAAAGVTHYGGVVGTGGGRGTGTRGGAGAGTWHGGICREEGRHLLELNIWEKGEEETRPHTISQERG